MFDELFLLERTASKHRSAPFAEERVSYLRHLKQMGTSRRTLLIRVNDLLNVGGGMVATRRPQMEASCIAKVATAIHFLRNPMASISRLV